MTTNALFERDTTTGSAHMKRVVRKKEKIRNGECETEINHSDATPGPQKIMLESRNLQCLIVPLCARGI